MTPRRLMFDVSDAMSAERICLHGTWFDVIRIERMCHKCGANEVTGRYKHCLPCRVEAISIVETRKQARKRLTRRRAAARRRYAKAR